MPDYLVDVITDDAPRLCPICEGPLPVTTCIDTGIRMLEFGPDACGAVKVGRKRTVMHAECARALLAVQPKTR